MYNFSDKTVIVTGGSRGIGKSIAEKFAALEAKVFITYKNAVDENHFNALGISHSRCDVAVYDEVLAFTDNVIKATGKIDILVNNAGMTKDSLLLRMSPEDWDMVMNTNAKGVFNFTKAVCKHMMSQKKGKIINISSVVGITGNAGQANYVASKAAVIGFTKAVARELASRNINVNCIAPGYIDTDMTSKLSDTIKQTILESVPLRRIGTGDDVAKAVIFLASEDADYITGQVLCVDGGMVM